MTITEKILSYHSDQESVSPDQLITTRIDAVLANDVTAPLAIKEFEKTGLHHVFDLDKVIMVLDHFTPNKDIQAAEQSRIVREFARQQGLTHFYDVGSMGVEHVLLPQEGLVLPGDVVVGADSHTCTYGALGAFATGVGSTDVAAAMATGELWFRVPASYKFIYSGQLQPWVLGKDLILYTIGQIGVDGALYKAMEFDGDALKSLSMDSRFTMANMAIEAGAKNGIFEPDQVVLDYVKKRAKREYHIFKSDPDAEYEKIYQYDVSNIEPQVALPHLPSNVKGISELGEIIIDQVVIGSCTNGRSEDLKIAHEVIKGKKVDPRVRLIIIPATQEVYLEALKNGWIETFVTAGAAVSTPTCGPCLGGHMGILAEGERAVATTNRNFVGRMGHPKSEVYLTSPAVAAASAVAGKIVSPDEVA